MNFAENNRISHRQLYRQMVLAFLSPFLLCLFGKGKLVGVRGIAGTLAAMALLLFYVIFLMRLAPCCERPLKYLGNFTGRIGGVFFVVYVLLTGAFLLSVLAEIVPESLVAGVSGRWLSFFAILAAAMGTRTGMQRRGRVAEVSGALVLAAVLLMMILGAGQGKLSYLLEIMPLSDAYGVSAGTAGFLQNMYEVLCAFAGLGLLPFALEDVKKQGSTGKVVAFAVVTLGGILIGMQLLLPAVFGRDRLLAEKYPVLPLLSGADLPGNVLARFDVLWMGFLLYGLLFSIGSLLHYGHQIIRKVQLGTGRVWMAVLVYLLSLWKFEDYGIQDYYGIYLGYVFLPGMLFLQILFMWRRNRRRKKKLAAGVMAVFICMSMSGCAGVEPEERMYALALGVDASPEGIAVTYGTPDMSKATGQGKPGSDGKEVLTVSGADFEEVEELYGRSQEKFMDMGHLETLIISDTLIEDGRWAAVLEYLENEPFVGENVYVFRAAEARAVLAWNGGGGSSAGEYVKGLLENDFNGKRKERGVTLRELYHRKYKSGELLELPRIMLVNEELQITAPSGSDRPGRT